MKKIFLSVLLLVMLISMNYTSADAQPCPTGYTETTATFTYSSGTTTCIYTVDFCFQCSPTHSDMKVNINWISVDSQECFDQMKLHFSDILASAKQYIIDNYTYSLCNDAPPCNQGSRPTYIYVPRCWQVYNACDNYILRACDDVYFCKSTYNVCWDYNYSPPRKTSTFVSNIPYGGTPPCPTTITFPNPFPCYTFTDCWQPFTCE